MLQTKKAKKFALLLALMLALPVLNLSGSKRKVKKQPKQPTQTLYVSAEKGHNRNNGSKEKPYKDLQKAVDEAKEGAVIYVAQGNYQGKLDAGYISIKKYISLVGGFNNDFTKRDPIQFQTMVRPGPATSGTGANFGLLDIYVKGKKDGEVLIDGFILDKGEMNCYFLPNPKIEKSGTPQGCETGRLDPPRIWFFGGT